MKYLSDYMDERGTAIMDKYGAFYAFSTKQFNEAKKEGVKYANCGSGLIAPSEHAVTLIKELVANVDASIAQDLAENGKDKIIERELINHEAFYTGDIDSTFDALETYEVISREDIRAIFIRMAKTQAYE